MNTIHSNEFKQYLSRLYKFLSKKLGIKNHPNLKLVDDISKTNEFLAGTGHYDSNTNSICVYVAGRHPKDVLRTFAHEVVHHKQREIGSLDNSNKGNDPKYTQNDPHLRNMEKQAYLVGNILFRDWEDQEKYGESKKVNEVVILNEDIKINNRKELFDSISKVLSLSIKNGWISSINRPLTTAKMNPEDFVQGLAVSLMTCLEKQIDGDGGINVKSDKYNTVGGQGMIQ